MNKAIIAGYVGKDPTIRDTQGGPVANLSIATTTRRKNGEVTQWHRVTCFGNQANAVAEYIRKGSWLMVEGEIQYSQYQDKETGQTRYSTDIVAHRVEFGPKTSSSTTTPAGEEEYYPEPGSDG
jgi:single-strand DNA-binding protein